MLAGRQDAGVMDSKRSGVVKSSFERRSLAVAIWAARGGVTLLVVKREDRYAFDGFGKPISTRALEIEGMSAIAADSCWSLLRTQ